MGLRRRRGIKRFSVPAFHTISVPPSPNTGWGNVPASYDIQTVEAKYCTLQDTKPNQIGIDTAGIHTTDMFTMYTETPLFEPEEGSTTFQGSGIYIPPSFFQITDADFVHTNKGGYYKVIKSTVWNNGVIPHYKVLVMKDYTVDPDKYPVQKVADTASQMDTLSKYKNGDWVNEWTS